MADVFQIRARHQQAIIDHALSQKPIEACGLIASSLWSGGRGARLIRMNNIAEEWGTAFEFEPEQQMAVWNDMELRGEVAAAIYHSHTRHDPIPSIRDIAGAKGTDPLATHIIVSVKDEVPEIRAWKMTGFFGDPQYIKVNLEVIE